MKAQELYNQLEKDFIKPHYSDEWSDYGNPEFMKADDTPYASLESLYRAPLGVFLTKELGDRACNIYIEAPLELRAEREMQKLNKKAEETGTPEISFEKMLDKVTKKDKLKKRLKPTDVRNIAQYVIVNDDKMTKEGLLAEVDKIAKEKGVKLL